MKVKIIKIGNSHGVRIPKPFLEETGLNGTVEMEVRDDEIVVRKAHEATRTGWSEAFKKMAAQKDDQLLDSDAPGSSWDDEDWVWE